MTKNVNKARGNKKPPAKSVKARAPRRAPATDRTVAIEDNDEVRARFLVHRGSWNSWRAKRKAVDDIESKVKAALKADGFKVKEFEVADALIAGPKQAAKIREEVTLRLRVARWMGHPMGGQLDLFEDATEAPPSHYDAGKQAAMEHLAAKPPHDPGTDAYVAWMNGYHDETARKVKAGIKPLKGNGELDEGAQEEGEEDGNPVAEVGPRNPARPLSDFH